MRGFLFGRGGQAKARQSADNSDEVVFQRGRRGRTPSPRPSAAARLPLSGGALARLRSGCVDLNVVQGGLWKPPRHGLRPRPVSPFQGALPVQARSVVCSLSRGKAAHQRTSRDWTARDFPTQAPPERGRGPCGAWRGGFSPAASTSSLCLLPAQSAPPALRPAEDAPTMAWWWG